MCVHVLVGPWCLLSMKHCINHKGSGSHSSHYGVPLESRPGPDYPSRRGTLLGEERPFARSPPEKTNSILVTLTSQRKATHREKTNNSTILPSNEFSLSSASSITPNFKIFMSSDCFLVHTARKSISVEITADFSTASLLMIFTIITEGLREPC